MTHKQFKEHIKHISQLNKMLENHVTFYEENGHLNYENYFKNKFDWVLSRIKLNDIVTDIIASYKYLEDAIGKAEAEIKNNSSK